MHEFAYWLTYKHSIIIFLKKETMNLKGSEERYLEGIRRKEKGEIEFNYNLKTFEVMANSR